MYFGINLPIKKNTKILFDEKLPVPHSKLDQFYNWDNLESLKTYYIISFFVFKNKKIGCYLSKIKINVLRTEI